MEAVKCIFNFHPGIEKFTTAMFEYILLRPSFKDRPFCISRLGYGMVQNTNVLLFAWDSVFVRVGHAARKTIIVKAVVYYLIKGSDNNCNTNVFFGSLLLTTSEHRPPHISSIC